MPSWHSTKDLEREKSKELHSIVPRCSNASVNNGRRMRTKEVAINAM